MMTESPGLDPFTKRYLAGLLVVAAISLIWWVSGWDSRVNQLNAVLEADAELAAYPYPFKVFSVENGIAQMSSPRSADVPVIQFLRVAYPELRNSGVMDKAVMAAQDQLASMQSRAGKLVSQQDDVTSVRWVIDRNWYASQGIYLD